MSASSNRCPVDWRAPCLCRGYRFGRIPGGLQTLPADGIASFAFVRYCVLPENRLIYFNEGFHYCVCRLARWNSESALEYHCQHRRDHEIQMVTTARGIKMKGLGILRLLRKGLYWSSLGFVYEDGKTLNVQAVLANGVSDRNHVNTNQRLNSLRGLTRFGQTLRRLPSSAFPSPLSRPHSQEATPSPPISNRSPSPFPSHGASAHT